VECLLEEPRVVAVIDVKSTREYKHWAAGSTALHIACQSATDTDKTRIVELLLEAGADPTLKNEHGQTPLDLLRLRNPGNHAAITLLERALSEPQRTFVLSKSRHLINVLHVVTKTAKKAEETATEKSSACLTKVPDYLTNRVTANMSLPEVSLVTKGRPWCSASETTSAVLQYVLRAEELGEKGGMSADVFVELINMMVPGWYQNEEREEDMETQSLEEEEDDD
jgi:hypothetical protein